MRKTHPHGKQRNRHLNTKTVKSPSTDTIKFRHNPSLLYTYRLETEKHPADKIADLIDLKASLQQLTPLLTAWRTTFIAQLETADQEGAVDILSVLQQARVVSSLADLSAYDLLDHVTTMGRLSAGIESDELFARQLRRKFLHES